MALGLVLFRLQDYFGKLYLCALDFVSILGIHIYISQVKFRRRLKEADANFVDPFTGVGTKNIASTQTIAKHCDENYKLKKHCMRLF